ncbi:MAG: hypothetical protein ABF381_03320 [Akkermansiaceae bacterium]
MKPYLTILLDSFRMLKARTIFWVTLAISLFVALVYLSIGFDETGTSLFFGLSHFESDMFREGTSQSETLYVAIFTKIIAEYWLSWIAVLLALISCVAIFPESLKEGVAGMLLTKKLSRFQVFSAKFIGSLLFVTIQVLVFVLIVFVALRWRLGSWNPSIFWYVPLILLVFTYLYSFMMVVAVKTRSVMTALVLTLVLWAVSSIIGFFEGNMYSMIKTIELSEKFEAEARQSAKPLEVDVEAEDEEEAEAQVEEPEVREASVVVRDNGDSGLSTMKQWYQRLLVAYAIFPKTGRTMEIGDRLLVVNGEKGSSKGSFMSIMMGLEEEREQNDIFVEISQEAVDRHSATYAIGTSVLFSLAMLIWAGGIFCRKEI